MTQQEKATLQSLDRQLEALMDLRDALEESPGTELERKEVTVLIAQADVLLLKAQTAILGKNADEVKRLGEAADQAKEKVDIAREHLEAIKATIDGITAVISRVFDIAKQIGIPLTL